MSESTFQRAFAGGELAPSLAARADLAKYLTGLRACRNLIVLRHGGVANRPGTRFVNDSRDHSTATRLLRFVAAVEGESVLIESGPYYFRFYRAGALVRLTDVAAWDGGGLYPIGAIARHGGVNYYCTEAHTNRDPPDADVWYPMPGDVLELPTPYNNGAFTWTQSGNVLTLTSSLVPPHEIIYVGLTQWIIQAVDTRPVIGPPTDVAIAPGVSGARAASYVVTAAAATSYEESTASAAAQVLSVGEPTPDDPHVVTWTAPAGTPAAAEYYIYKDPYQNGTFGYIGTATGATTFNDIGFTPDFALTPPQPRVLFTTARHYPQRAGYYQQRRFFASTLEEPDAIWASRVGFHSNFTLSSPLQEDDALTFKIAGRQANPVRHLFGLKALIVLTAGGAWTIGQAKEALTPSNLPADQETFDGVSDVTPVIVGNTVLYVQARNSILRDLAFDQQVEGLAGRDLTLFASHLFDGFTITNLDYQETPHSIVWACRSDGALLGLTYLRDQEVWGWHRHDSGAAARFEDVCVVPEATGDVVYLLVRRTIGGVFRRSIEKLESRTILNWARDGFFVDAGLTATGSNLTRITGGLAHLEGQVVAVVADGKVIFDGNAAAAGAAGFRVTGGAIAATFPAASIVHVGLPITVELETLDLDVQGTAIRDQKKRVGSVTLLLEASARTFQAGPRFDLLRQVQLDPIARGSERVPFTGQESITLVGEYNDHGRVCVRHTDPLAFTVLGILPRVEMGG